MQTNWNRALDSFRDGMIYYLLFNNDSKLSLSVSINYDKYMYNNTVITPTIVIKMWRIGLFSHYNEQLSDANVMSHYRK